MHRTTKYRAPALRGAPAPAGSAFEGNYHDRRREPAPTPPSTQHAGSVQEAATSSMATTRYGTGEVTVVQDSLKTTAEAQSASRDVGRLGLVLDIALPLVAYYVLHAFGASDWAALLAATAAAGLRLVVVTVRSRQVSWFSTVMLVFFGVGLVLAFLGGDPRFLLLKDSFSTALLGGLFLSAW